MTALPRVTYPTPPRYAPEEVRGFVSRFKARMRQADADGLLPWATDCCADYSAGLAIGIKVVGRMDQLHALNPRADGEALGLPFVVCIFPEAAAWIVAQDESTPRDFVGSRAQMAYVLHHLALARLMPDMSIGAVYGSPRRFGIAVEVRGVGTLRALPISSDILKEEGAGHG